jgi:hypothetical protein
MERSSVFNQKTLNSEAAVAGTFPCFLASHWIILLSHWAISFRYSCCNKECEFFRTIELRPAAAWSVTLRYFTLERGKSSFCRNVRLARSRLNSNGYSALEMSQAFCNQMLCYHHLLIPWTRAGLVEKVIIVSQPVRNMSFLESEGLTTGSYLESVECFQRCEGIRLWILSGTSWI